MKALIRDYDGQQFVYINVKHNGKSFVDEKGQDIYLSSIVDVFRDNRSKYVRCSNCGELIKNTPEAIEAHWRDKANKKNCLQCNKMAETYEKTPIKKTYVPDPQNPTRYIVTNKYAVKLVCRSGYYSRTIGTDAANESCKFLACKFASYQPINDIFTEYPHPFDTLPTVDMLLQKRWKLVGFERMNNYIAYSHPSLKSLQAHVNSKGIVSYFTLKVGSRDWCFMYSKRYDKHLYFDGVTYYKDFPYEVRNASKSASAFAKAKELFEEEK